MARRSLPCVSDKMKSIRCPFFVLVTLSLVEQLSAFSVASRCLARNMRQENQFGKSYYVQELLLRGRGRVHGSHIPSITLTQKNAKLAVRSPSFATSKTYQSSCSCCGSETHSHSHNHYHAAAAPKIKRITLLSISLWLVSLLSFIDLSGTAIPASATLFTANLSRLRYAGLFSFALSIPTVFSKASRAIFRRHRIDASCMMLGAAVGAVALGEFSEAAAVASLFAVSETLEGRAAWQSTQALSRVARDLGPETARLVINVTATIGSSEMVEVPADQVVVGSIISVPVGEKIPCDGVVTSGESNVDQSTLTGESRPIPKLAGDTISAGTVNTGPGQLVVRTTAPSSASAVARLAQLVQDSKKHKSPTETLVDRFASLYTPLVFLAALAMCTLPRILLGPGLAAKTWSKRSLVTLVAACPCPLVISTPVTYVAALAHATRQGIIIKGGAILENLGKVKKVAFDKTGTLTEGKFALQDLKLTSSLSLKEVLEYLALVESPSTHPIATVLVDAARKEGAVLSGHDAVTNHRILEGEGLVANIGGKTVYVGNTRLFERRGIYNHLEKSDRAVTEKWAESGATVGFMSIEGAGIVCMYAVADSLREEATEVVHRLGQMGIDVCIISGDGKDATNAIGNQVGVPKEKIYSGLFPDQKLEVISELKKQTHAGSGGKVLMCGDGVNDAPALALVDVGVAMGTGAALATETSDITLTDPDLNKLVYGINLGKRAVRTIIQNFTFSLGMKTLVLGLAAFGVTSLWAAIASDVGTMLLVTTNGLKLLPSTKEKA